MFMGGTSEIARTKSTVLIYENEIRDIISEQERDDILIFTPEDLKNIEGYSNKVDFLVKKIADNPEKKIVIDFPLFIKEFSFVGGFTTEEGKWTQYAREMLKRWKATGSLYLRFSNPAISTPKSIFKEKYLIENLGKHLDEIYKKSPCDVISLSLDPSKN